MNVLVSQPLPPPTTDLNPAVCASGPGLGGRDWSGSKRLRHTFTSTHEGGPDLRKTDNLRAVQLLIGHTKVDSTVRYLGVELEDALSIAEQIDI